MPSIITASQLRTVLGVSVSLYSDAYLDSIINSAEQVILPLLTANQNAIASVPRTLVAIVVGVGIYIAIVETSM